MHHGAITLFSVKRETIHRALLVLAAALAFSASAVAQTWTGAAMDAGNWNNANNWNPVVVPNLPTADVFFTDTGAGNVVILAGVQARSLAFNTAAGAYTVTSQPNQTLSSLQAITVAASNTTQQTINLANVAAGSLLFTGTGSAALTITNNADPSVIPTLVIGPNTVIGTAAGGGGITVGGTGRTAISGSFSATQPVTGGLTKIGPGVLVLSGNGTNLGGPISLIAGTLRLDYSAITAIKYAGAGGLFSTGVDIEIVPHAATAITQNTAGTILTAGHTAAFRTLAGAAVTFGAGGFSRGAGTTFDTAATAGTLTVTTTTGTTNGLLGTGPAFATMNGSLWAGVSGGQLAGNAGSAGIFGAGTNTLISGNTSIPTVTTNSLRFDVGSATATLNGTLTLQSGGILVANTADSPTFVGGTVATTSEMIVHQYSPGTLTINSAISAPAGLTKTGPGLLSLGGSLTTSGPININRGGLQITTTSAVSSATAINFNDNRTGATGLQQFTVQLGNGLNGTISRPIRLGAHSAANSYATVFSTGTSLNSTVTLSGVISSAPGAVTPLRVDGPADDSSRFNLLIAANTFTGTVQVANGTLGIGSNASLGNAANAVVLSLGNFLAGGLEFLDTGIDVARPISITAFSRVVSSGTSVNTISGPVTGSILIKDGTGTLELTNAGNAGTRQVNGGTLRVNAAGLGTSGDYYLNNGTALAVTGTATLDAARTVVFGSTFGGGTGPARAAIDVAAGQTFTVAGLINEFANPGILVKTGPGTLIVAGLNNFYTGGTVVQAGELRVSVNGGLGAAAAPVSVEPAGALTFTTSTTTARIFNLNGGSLGVAVGQTLTFANASVFGGFLVGPGSFATQSGTTNTFVGNTASTLTNLSLAGTDSLTNFTNGGLLTKEAGSTATLTRFTNTSSGRIVVNGTANASEFVSNGLLTVSVGGLVNNTASNLVLGGGSTTFVGSVANPGGAINLSGGTTIELNGALLANNGTINGTVNVNYGALAKGSGVYGVVNVNQGGVYAPGNSPGISTAAAVTFDNSPVTSGAPALSIELGGTAPGTQYDRLHVTGNLSLGGTLAVSLVNSFTPAAGNSFDILNWGTLSGTFSTINLPTLSGLAWNTSQLYTTGVLSLVAAGLVGDYSQNGSVDAADYVVWRKNEGTMTTLPNDPHGGTIGAAQYNTWRANFGQTPGSGAAVDSSSTAAVPEPAGSVMLLTGILAIFFRRRAVVS